MEWKSLTRGLFSPRSTQAPFVEPATVFEVQPGFVAGARIERASGKVRRIGVRRMEAGSIIAAAHRPNVAKPDALEAAIRAVAEDLGGVTAPLGLILPDSAVRVTLLSFETLPSDQREQESLIRWKLKEVLPFAPDEARLTYAVYPPAGGSSLEVAALVGREQVVREYEAALESQAGEVRLLLPASAALLPLLPNGPGGGDLLLHAYGNSLVAAVVVGDRLRLWRYQTLENGAAELPEQTVTQEAARVLASASDRWGIKVERAWLCARPPLTRALAARVASGLDLDVRNLELGSGVAAHLSPEEKGLLDQYGITFAGLAARKRM